MQQYEVARVTRSVNVLKLPYQIKYPPEAQGTRDNKSALSAFHRIVEDRRSHNFKE